MYKSSAHNQNELDIELSGSIHPKYSLDELKGWIEKGANPNTYVNEFTALMWATYTGQIEKAKYLCEVGARTDVKGRCNETLLILAAGLNSSLDLVQFFLTKGIDVNTRDFKGDTALMVAARCMRDITDPYGNRQAIVKYLIEQGAIFNESDKTNFLNNNLYRKQEAETVLKFISEVQVRQQQNQEKMTRENDYQKFYNIQQRALQAAQQEAVRERQRREEAERQLNIQQEKELKIKEETIKVSQLKGTLPTALSVQLQSGKYMMEASENGLKISYLSNQPSMVPKNALRVLKETLRGSAWVKDFTMKNDAILIETNNPEDAKLLSQVLEKISSPASTLIAQM